jgi:integrase
MQIRQTIAWRGADWTVSEPKTKESRRRIELTVAALAALRRRKIAQLEERLRAAGGYEDLDLVFANEVGRPMNPSNVIARSFRPLLLRAGLPQIRFHDLRHTAATILLGRGVHPKIVSEMLGHSTVAVTLDTYSHVTPTMQREAASVFDQVVGGAR